MGLPMPHITSFCCCLGLETGSRIIAFVHLILSLCLVVVCSVFATKFRDMSGTVEDAGDHVYTTWYKIATAVAILSTVHVLLACTLIYGVHKRQSCCLRVWVCTMSLLLAAALLFNVVEVALWGAAGSGSDIFLAFLEAIIFFGLVAYCILCVHSFYLMLKSSEDMEGPSQTPY